MVKRTWKGDEVAKRLRRRLERNANQLGAYLAGEVRKSINTGQPTRRTPGGYVVGLNPSAPGQPPHRLSGRLIQSTGHRVQTMPKLIRLTYGAGTVYARRLELGYTGTDAKGRNVRQAARPFVRPALLRNVRMAARILSQ